jgi:ATP-binding cassette subfamily B protein
MEFSGVSFGYPGARALVHRQLDLTISAGEVLAVVGPNGAGKTTLIKLLAGLIPPSGGRILVNDTDLARLDPVLWRRRISVMSQTFNKYPMTLADNVALGAPEHRTDHAGIVDALGRAGLGDLVDQLSSGLDTPLTRERSGGVGLSGGQWQRVAIARALFAVAHQRDVLVLDEPTAHLDARAEAEFYQRVVAALAGITVLLISHRMSTVRHADRIVLLRDGRIAECGDHDTLLAAGGEYARMFDLQAAPFRDGGGPRW